MNISTKFFFHLKEVKVDILKSKAFTEEIFHISFNHFINQKILSTDKKLFFKNKTFYKSGSE